MLSRWWCTSRTMTPRESRILRPRHCSSRSRTQVKSSSVGISSHRAATRVRTAPTLATWTQSGGRASSVQSWSACGLAGVTNARTRARRASRSTATRERPCCDSWCLLKVEKRACSWDGDQRAKLGNYIRHHADCLTCSFGLCMGRNFGCI
ncbi:hypothetical protein BKA93DRAFT_205631 [Sparassis latifolia]